MSLQENDIHNNIETQPEEASSRAIVPELTSQLSLIENEEIEQITPLNDQPRMSIERPFENEGDKNEANPMSLRHAKTPNYLEKKLQEIQDENSRSMDAEVDLRKSESKPNEEMIPLDKQLTVEDIEVEKPLPDQNDEMTIITKEHNEEALKEETVVQNLEAVLNEENIQVENNKVEEEPVKESGDQIETESIEKKCDAPVTEEGQVENKEEIVQVSKTEENSMSNDENEANSVKSQPENLPKEPNTARKIVVKRNMSVSSNTKAMATSGKKLLNTSEQSARKSAVVSATKSTNSVLNTSTKKRKFDAIQIENLQQTPSNDVSQQLKKVKKSDTPQQLLSGKNGSQIKQIHIQKLSNTKTPEMKNSGFLKKSSGAKSGYSSKYMKENVPEDQNQPDTKKTELNLNVVKLSGLKPAKCCTFCGGNFETKTEYKTLSCLHRAHNDCYTSMEKKKKAQCPSCNSNTSFVNTAQSFSANQKVGGIKF